MTTASVFAPCSPGTMDLLNSHRASSVNKGHHPPRMNVFISALGHISTPFLTSFEVATNLYSDYLDFFGDGTCGGSCQSARSELGTSSRPRHRQDLHLACSDTLSLNFARTSVISTNGRCRVALLSQHHRTEAHQVSPYLWSRPRAILNIIQPFLASYSRPWLTHFLAQIVATCINTPGILS